MNIKRTLLVAVVVAIGFAGSASAQEPPTDVHKIVIPDIAYGQLYYKSEAFAKPDSGPVELPDPGPSPDIRPLPEQSASRVPGSENTSVMNPPSGRVPVTSELGFMGGALPAGGAAGFASDPVRDTERRLRKLIRRLDG